VNDFSWKPGTCPVCKTANVKIGRAWIGVLGATPADEPKRFLIDLPSQCEGCLNKQGLNRRMYGIPGNELDGGIFASLDNYLPIARRKIDEHWNYRASAGALDPNNFEPAQKRDIQQGER
jgi:hypothetical protein